MAGTDSEDHSSPTTSCTDAGRQSLGIVPRGRSLLTGGGYIHGYDGSVVRAHSWRTVENSATYLLGHLRPGRSVLDVGCGPGTITADIARRVAPGRVLGVDSSDAVLDIARREWSEVPNCSFRRGDALHLDHADDSFDIVHAHQLLQHVPDPVAAMREMRRVCRPDGVVAVRDADYGGFIWTPADPRLDHWRATYRSVARANGGEPDAGRHLLSWARGAGFREIHSSASVWCFSDDEGREWWGGQWAERLVRSDFADHAVAGGHATKDDLASMSEAFRSWSREPNGWFVVLHGELLAHP